MPDGTIQTACQQACPTEAIVFGDQSDPSSRVARLGKDQRAYRVIDHVGTRPRVSYLARVRNLNPEMPEGFVAPAAVPRGDHQGQPAPGHNGHEPQHEEE